MKNEQPRWVKLCTKDLKYRTMQLTLGENVDTNLGYDPVLHIQGGLHFCEEKDALKRARDPQYNWVCDVEIPSDADVVHGVDRSKASKIILSNHRPFWECTDMLLAAMRHDGRSLACVPTERATSAMYLAAVQQAGAALEYVPVARKTPDICLTAVQQNGWALWYVPAELKTFEICLAAVQRSGTSLEYVPVKLKTLAMCLAAVQQDGVALKYVPSKLKTTKVCLAAVQQDRRAMLHVPMDLHTHVRMNRRCV